MTINLYSEGVALPNIDRQKLSQWIKTVAESHGYGVGELSYIFCNDDYILLINRQFLQHDYYTDIITFDYSKRLRISGDMVISLDTVASNAAMLGRDYNEELRRVIIHGVLHLLGINDKGPGEREIMERHEDEALSICPENLINDADEQ